jgi:molybdopterin/thiamine biosynthesis adenylyltransferase/rhodanese-related sulfurtransferase
MTHLPDLSAVELGRYHRQMSLPELGADGQRRLKAARVLLVGVGGLGSPAALYLAAAGVGAIGLIEVDVVDETNLHRQVVYATADVGTSKLAAASARLHALNPHVALERHDESFSAANGRRLVEAYDVVIDGTDNFPTRYLVNDACVLAGRPNVYGSVYRFEGQASVFAVPTGPCYRCLHPEPPPAGLIPTCAEGGVLGVLPGIIGTLQATEAIKLITGVGEPLIGRLLLYDALRMRFREVALPRDVDCPVCGLHPMIRDLVAYDLACEPSPTLSTDALRQWRAEGRPHLLVDVREPSEHAAAWIDGALLVPLGELSRHLDRLPRQQPVVVYCQSGGRSARAVALLRSRGYDARSLAGGILAWSNAFSDDALRRG